MSLAELLRAHRTDAALTIEMLAERSSISDRTISDIERGISRSPQQRTLQALAQALSLSADDAKALHRAAKVRPTEETVADRVTAIAPARIPDFTGRLADIEAVAAYLRMADGPEGASRVVVMCGSPGIGKTTAAVEALRQTGTPLERSYFVDLAGLGGFPLTPLQTLQSLLQQAGETGLFRTVDQAAAAWRQASQQQNTVVLLDNAGTEEQVRAVIATSVGCSVIVTARRSLSGLEGTFRVKLHPLAQAESTQLLGRIIPAAQRTDSELAELAELCGDVPLALRIAGNRIASQPSWTAGDFITRMRQEGRRLRTLTAGDLGVAAAFASSYDDLSSELQDLFRSLSLIERPEFDAQLASSIIPTEPLDTGDLLDELTELGLLEGRGSFRFHLHDLARLFAADRLRTEAPADLTRTRRENLRRWLVTTAANAGSWFEPDKPAPQGPAGSGLEFPSADVARHWLQTEAPNWFAAYRQTAALGEHEVVLAVAESMHWFSDLWVSWGHWHELFSLAAAAATAVEDPIAEATQWGYVAWADMAELADFGLAESDARRACSAADRAADPKQQGWARFYLSWARDLMGETEQSIHDAQQALGFFESADDREGVLQATALLAAGCRQLAGPDRAIEAHHELLAQLADNSAAISPSVALFTRSSAEQLLAEEYLSTGRTADAITWARSSLDAARQVDYPLGVIYNLLTLAEAHAADGDWDMAQETVEQAAHIAASRALSRADSRVERMREMVRQGSGSR